MPPAKKAKESLLCDTSVPALVLEVVAGPCAGLVFSEQV